MIRKNITKTKDFKENNPQIVVKTKISNSNLNINSPELSRQENNYFYNTKINRLILQEAPNNNIQNLYQQPSQINKSISSGLNYLQGKENNIFLPKAINENFFARNSSFENLPIDLVKFKQESYNNKSMSPITYINFSNDYNNENFQNIFVNNKGDEEILSKSYRFRKKISKNQIPSKKNNIKQYQINNYYTKNKNMPIVSLENNYFQKSKNNIKNKYVSPKIILSQAKEINEFKNKQDLYKKETEFKRKTKNRKELLNSSEITNLKENNNFKSKILNHDDIIYFKNNPKNNKSIKIIKRNNQTKGNKVETKNKSFKIYENNLLIKKLQIFCEMLEEIFFTSFKSSYNYFIQNLVFFAKNRNLSRTQILRRFNVNKRKKLKTNNSMTQINIKDENRYKNIIYKNKDAKKFIESFAEDNKKKSPSKFSKLENNLANSMVKIKNDKYNQMFNNLLNKENIDKKQFFSSMINPEFGKIKDISLKKSFDSILANYQNNDKYNTNTNKFNKLKISTEIEPTKNYFIDDNNIPINLKKNNNKNKNFETLNEQEIYLKNRLTNYIPKTQQIKITKGKKNLFINDNNKNIENLNLNNNEKYKDTHNNRNDILYCKPLNIKSIENKKKEKNRSAMKIESNKGNNLDHKFYSNIKSRLNDKMNEYDIANYNEPEEIIIKNVKTEDKRLFVFIKYIDLGYNNISWSLNEEFLNQNLFIIRTDSITIGKNSIKNNAFKSEYAKHHIIDNKNKLERYKKHSIKNINYNSNLKDIPSINKKNYNKIIVINDNLKNSTKYLISLLQNIYNENIKIVLNLLLKNAGKNKRDSLFFSKDINMNKDINSYKNKIQSSNKENKFQIELSNITQNKNDENINELVINNSNYISVNKNIIISNSINNENFSNKKLVENSAENSNKVKMKNKIDIDKNIENQENKFENNEKEKIEKKRLAKLSKLFNNLNKENNIINVIKEQFLDWANKNENQFQNSIELNAENKENSKLTIEYNAKTFDIKNLFHKTLNHHEKNFQDKINGFRYNLISFIFNRYMKKISPIKGENIYNYSTN